MVKSSRSMLLLVCLSFLVIVSSPQNGVQADIYVGSCSPATAKDYVYNCDRKCKGLGYKSGHCGSWWWVNCWCDQD
ncbi:defensin-like [Chrysoperla carnea]|uniref:defensin-like n=1 Tax=Chrysoperla carnea TaxID=189513 RepID=UPI001D094B70|nr:defensin-like [Chrysoperla carnea]